MQAGEVIPGTFSYHYPSTVLGSLRDTLYRGRNGALGVGVARVEGRGDNEDKTMWREVFGWSACLCALMWFYLLFFYGMFVLL